MNSKIIKYWKGYSFQPLKLGSFPKTQPSIYHQYQGRCSQLKREIE